MEEPAYVFGRFRVVRRAYGHLRSAQQALAPARDGIGLCELYGAPSVVLPVRPSDSLEDAGPPTTHLANLAREAFSTGLTLTAPALADLVRDARGAALKGVNVRGLTYEQLDAKPEVRAAEPILSVLQPTELASVQALAADSLLVAIAGGHLGYRPIRVSAWLFWSLKNDLCEVEREKLNQTVRFHYDVDGYNFVYANFYLSDVDAQSGAHVLISGTHRNKKLRQLFGSARIDDAEALACFGEGRVHVIEGPAGTGFVEDTSCYHKALAPMARDRLMLQLRYQ